MCGSCALFFEKFPEYRIDVGGAVNRLHGEIWPRFRHLFIFHPKAMGFVIIDFDVGVILHARHDFVGEQAEAIAGILGPVVAVGSLSAVNVPIAARVTVADDVAHQFQRTGYHGAAGFAGVEKVLFVHFEGHGVVANEYHLGLFVVSR